MPIVNGQYISPTWQNGGPPPIDSDELNAISETLERLDSMPWHDTSDATATAAQILAPYTAYIADGKVTGTMETVSQAVPSISVSASGLITATSNQNDGYVEGGVETATEQLSTQGAQTITPGTTAQTIQSGVYLTGTQTIEGDTDLVAGNIREGVSIFGVTGTYSGAALPSLSNPGTASDLLSGKQLINQSGSVVTGSMTNRGAVSQSLNAGGSYTIPAGYHNGSGRVTANSLASQTAGTATASDIASGETAWVNGVKITGTNSGSNLQTATISVINSSRIPATLSFSTLNFGTPTASFEKPPNDGSTNRYYPIVGTVLVLAMQGSAGFQINVSGTATLVDETMDSGIVYPVSDYNKVYRIAAASSATITITY